MKGVEGQGIAIRVSVIIPCYNAAEFLRETLDSIVGQTYPVADVIVVDDGSKDETAAIARRYGAPVRVLTQANAGAAAARNHGLRENDADLIAFIDADDLWLPGKMARQVEYLDRHPEAGGVAADFVVFGSHEPEQIVRMSDAALRMLNAVDFLAAPRVHPSTLLVRGDIARSVRFPEGTTACEDVVYAALVRAAAPIGAVEEVLMRRRRHPNQETQSLQHFTRAFRGRLDWGQDHYRELGAESSEQVRSAILEGTVNSVLARYWARDIDAFHALRSELLAGWPADAPVPNELQRTRVTIPALLRAKDSFDRLRRG